MYTGVYESGGIRSLGCARDDKVVRDDKSDVIPNGVRDLDGWRMKMILPPCAIAVEDLIAELNRLGAAYVDMECNKRGINTPEAERMPVVHLLGDGVPVYLKELREGLIIPYAVAPFHRDRQSAEAVCALAFELVREGKVVDANAFAPEYIRGGPEPAV